MNFGFPQFFWALTALSIPLLIHLFNLRRPKTVFFSNTRFLKHLEQEQRSVKRLRHWLVLLLRGLALAALVTAFTLPYQEEAALSNSEEEVYLHLYLDNSLSMQRDGPQGPLLNQAKLYSRELLNNLGEAVSVQILCNNAESRFQRYYRPQEALELLGQIDYSSNSRDFQTVLSKIRDLGSPQEGQHEIVFISDFQASLFPETDIELRENENLSLLPLEAVLGNSNIAIDSVSFESPVFVPGLAQQMTVYLRNYKAEAVDGLSLEFRLNDTLQQARLINLAAQETEEFNLQFIPKYSGAYRAEVSINKGEPKFDNQLYFSFQTLSRQKVYLLGENGKSNLPLQIFENEYFDFKSSETVDVDYDFLSESRLIILESEDAISESLNQKLQEHLQEGKNIWIFPRAKAAVYRDQLQKFGISIGDDWQTDSLMAQELNTKDPYLERSFESSSKPPLLPYTKSWLSLKADLGAHLLAAGANRPLLKRIPKGEGQVFFSLSSLDPEQSDLAKHPLMVPLLANAALYSKGASNYYLRSGNVGDVQSIEAAYQEEALKMQSPNGALIPYQSFSNNRYQIALPGIDLKAGHYPITRAEETIAYLALNCDKKESNLKQAVNLNEQFKPQATIMEPESAAQLLSLSKRILQTKTALWPWFISLALVFLVLEMILLKFRKS